jgi:hypothetical protein
MYWQSRSASRSLVATSGHLPRPVVTDGALPMQRQVMFEVDIARRDPGGLTSQVSRISGQIPVRVAVRSCALVRSEIAFPAWPSRV